MVPVLHGSVLVNSINVSTDGQFVSQVGTSGHHIILCLTLVKLMASHVGLRDVLRASSEPTTPELQPTTQNWDRWFLLTQC